MKKEKKGALETYVKGMLGIHEKFAKKCIAIFNKTYPKERINFEENRGKLIVASAIATDKLWRMKLEFRKSPLYKKYDKDAQFDIVHTTFYEILLAIGLINRTPERLKIIYDWMIKYPDAFEIELPFWKKIDDKIRVTPHDFDDYRYEMKEEKDA